MNYSSTSKRKLKEVLETDSLSVLCFRRNSSCTNEKHELKNRLCLPRYYIFTTFVVEKFPYGTSHGIIFFIMRDIANNLQDKLHILNTYI